VQDTGKSFQQHAVYAMPLAREHVHKDTAARFSLTMAILEPQWAWKQDQRMMENRPA
jgi:hypothetical protein